MPRHFYIYILADHARALYTVVTNKLVRRLWQHRNGRGSQFAQRYRIDQLVYYEVRENSVAAIAREKQIKGYRREKKLALIESINPDWRDLALDWFPVTPSAARGLSSPPNSQPSAQRQQIPRSARDDITRQ